MPVPTLPMRTITVRTVSGTVEVTPGVLNAASRRALTGGHCAALAYLIHQRTGWPIVIDCGFPVFEDDAALAQAINERKHFSFKHVLVQRPDGMLVDAVDTINREDYILDRMDDEVVPCAALYEVPPELCKVFAEEYCVTPDWSLISTFVEPVLEEA